MTMPECPYCGFEDEEILNDMPGNSNKWDEICENCGNEFEVEIEWEPNFSTSRIYYFVCEICNKKTRKRGKYHSGKHEGKFMCETCYHEKWENHAQKLLSQEMKVWGEENDS